MNTRKFLSSLKKYLNHNKTNISDFTLSLDDNVMKLVSDTRDSILETVTYTDKNYSNYIKLDRLSIRDILDMNLDKLKDYVFSFNNINRAVKDYNPIKDNELHTNSSDYKVKISHSDLSNFISYILSISISTDNKGEYVYIDNHKGKVRIIYYSRISYFTQTLDNPEALNIINDNVYCIDLHSLRIIDSLIHDKEYLLYTYDKRLFNLASESEYYGYISYSTKNYESIKNYIDIVESSRDYIYYKIKVNLLQSLSSLDKESEYVDIISENNKLYIGDSSNNKIIINDSSSYDFSIKYNKDKLIKLLGGIDNDKSNVELLLYSNKYDKDNRNLLIRDKYNSILLAPIRSIC